MNDTFPTSIIVVNFQRPANWCPRAVTVALAFAWLAALVAVLVAAVLDVRLALLLMSAVVVSKSVLLFSARKQVCAPHTYPEETLLGGLENSFDLRLLLDSEDGHTRP